MVVRGLQALSGIFLGCAIFCFWPSLMHNLSRLYETLFLEVHYEYTGLLDKGYHRTLSWGLKNICLNQYASCEVLDFLDQIEEREKRLIWSHRNKLTEEVFVGGHHFIVKSEQKKGFISNLFSMGMAVNVWNNAHWAQKIGIPVLKPVAVVEKRKWNEVHTFVVYLFEGKDCEKVFTEDQSFFSHVENLQQLLSHKNVIHHDFRLRNILLLDDGSVQLIDIDKIHRYPRNSYIFRERMKREVRKFNANLHDHNQTTKRLVI